MHRLRYTNAKHAGLLRYASATLGSGNLREAVKLPGGEDPNEWIAVNGLCLLFWSHVSWMGGSIRPFGLTRPQFSGREGLNLVIYAYVFRTESVYFR